MAHLFEILQFILTYVGGKVYLKYVSKPKWPPRACTTEHQPPRASVSHLGENRKEATSESTAESSKKELLTKIYTGRG